MGTVLIFIWLGMGAAVITVMQVFHTRTTRAIKDKDRFKH